MANLRLRTVNYQFLPDNFDAGVAYDDLPLPSRCVNRATIPGPVNRDEPPS